MSISKYIINLTQRQINLIRIVRIPLDYIIIFLDLLYPKNSKLIIFGSYTGEYASGSPKALFDYVKENHPDYYIYYYLPFGKSMTFYGRIRYILHFLPIFLKAKFLVGSHPTNDFFPFSWSKRKKLINLWHGTPIKSHFFPDKGESKNNLKQIKKLSAKTTFFIVSSKLEAALISICFFIDPRKICYTGHPRNDILIKNKEKIKLNFENIPNYKKIILYCPTYRRKDNSKFFPFEDFDLNHLKRFLEEHEIIILIRGHVYNNLNKSERQLFSKRIIDCNFDKCNDITTILPEVDILITDYSSIYIDYLILDKPCIFLPYDLKHFSEERGLLLDDYNFWTPGNKVYTYNDFISSIINIINGIDTYKNKRREIKEQFHYYDYGNACKKVFKLIQKNK